MGYTAPGERVTRTAIRVFANNSPVVVNGVAGWGLKVKQLDRFVDPSSAAATQVGIGEVFEHIVVGVHEAPKSGGLADCGGRVEGLDRPGQRRARAPRLPDGR